jgi:hypothetical protein
MPSTYTPLATQTLSSPASTITFSSIPNTYTDLILIFNGSAASYVNTYLTINGDSSVLYSATRLYGNGTSPSSTSYSAASFSYAGDVQTSGSNGIIHFMSYANTNVKKTFISRDSAANGGVGAWAGLYNSTSAISSILFGATSGTNFNSGSTFTLYGIKAA